MGPISLKPEGKTGVPDFPLKNHKFIGFPINTGPDLPKIAKLPSQHSMWATIVPPAKRHDASTIARFLVVFGASLS